MSQWTKLQNCGGKGLHSEQYNIKYKPVVNTSDRCVGNDDRYNNYYLNDVARLLRS